MSSEFIAPPDDLTSGPARLQFEKLVPGDPERALVPWYHFKILDAEGTQLGHINFRIGDTDHVTMTAGHVGFAVHPEHRGFSVSYHACVALAPFIRRHYERVILTADPTNAASIRTIERLGAAFLDEVDVSPSDPAYASGARRKRRYEWTL